ncbi:hypothetical protein OQJ19_10920 [Fluoribacter gormanii]|uniref:hypothetical protein n=1 Tax=Fluoribacter gormanii TaxID=464 RepID=UPI002243D46A|nr:hypothetical protein [Fluoribacter gormanii]MCW8442685.1 hypothetical protein [Fluoribacter gormanii]MCW8471160.1 hypothetical protein [Fluoribacter gormanii]
MQYKFERSLSSLARQLEEQRLRKETNGIFAPAKPGIFAEKRKELVEEYVRKGLEKFDAQENQNCELFSKKQV